MRHEIDVNEFSPVVREFASYKTVIQGCSQRTVEQYLIDLRTFFRYLLCEGDQSILQDNEKFMEITVESVDLDALIAKVSKGAVTNTDYGTVQIYRASSNPVEVDTDFDGIDDIYDAYPSDNSFGGVMNYDDGKNTANVSFNVDYSLFFEPNTVYYNDLSKLAVLYASDIYSGCYIKVNQGASGGSDVATSFGKLFGLQDAEDIHITASEYALDKDDLTEFFVGHRTLYRSGEKKELVILSVRGTNGTNAEWTSNFDVGATTMDYYNAAGFDHPHWKDTDNHKGFDVATNRVLEKCGFVHEGTVRHGKMVSVYCDYHIWGMLREDYEAAVRGNVL